MYVQKYYAMLIIGTIDLLLVHGFSFDLVISCQINFKSHIIIFDVFFMTSDDR